MRSSHLMLAASLALAPAVAVSAPQPSAAMAKVDRAIGNTIIETYADGRTAEIWLAASGAYTGEGRRHDMSTGHWSVKGTKLCFTRTHPFAFGLRFCTPIPDVGMGQPWQAKAVTGEGITVRVVTGHVVGK